MNASHQRDYCSLYSDPDIMAYIGVVRTYLDLESQFLRTLMQCQRDNARYHVWMIHQTDSGNIVGLGSLTLIESSQDADIGVMLNASCRRRGLATGVISELCSYATNSLCIRRCLAWHHPENAAAAKLFLKLGFESGNDLVNPRYPDLVCKIRDLSENL